MKLFIAIMMLSMRFNSDLLAQSPDRSIGGYPSGVYNVSFVQLLATPEKYDGKLVQVVGYLNLEFEGNLIFLHKEDHENHLVKNAFWVQFSDRIKTEKKLNNYRKRYVVIIGRFKMNPENRVNIFSGDIVDITRLDQWIK